MNKLLFGLKCRTFFSSSLLKNIKYVIYGPAPVYILDSIYNMFGSELFRQNVGTPMGIKCAPLLLICFYFAMRELHEAFPAKKENDMVDAFNEELKVYFSTFIM